MSRYVVDASVAVEYLLRTPLGLTVAGMFEGASLAAPELMDAEVLSVLRRAVLNGHLEEARAEMAIDDLIRWPVDRISHRSLTRLAWQHRRNVSAYDAFYVAAARERGVPLITADGRLSRSPGLGRGHTTCSHDVSLAPVKRVACVYVPCSLTQKTGGAEPPCRTAWRSRAPLGDYASKILSAGQGKSIYATS